MVEISMQNTDGVNTKKKKKKKEKKKEKLEVINAWNYLTFVNYPTHGLATSFINFSW